MRGKATDPTGARTNSPAPGQPPLFAQAQRFELGGVEYALLSYPLPPDTLEEGLTASERAIADLVLRGLSTAEISRRRRRAERTVSNQIASLFRKLGVRSRRELTALFWSRERLSRNAAPSGSR